MRPPGNAKGGPSTTRDRPTQPPHRETRPPSVDDPTDFAEFLATLDAVDGHERHDARAYVEGYHDGYRAGYEIGRKQAEAEMERAWGSVAKKVRDTARQTTPAERAAMDASAAVGEPCQAKCGCCSRCIRADSVKRRGGDYTGGPVAWDTEGT